MCGIVGYVGEKPADDVIIAGLKTLEYRGYDSAGIALLDNAKQPHLYKQIGRVDSLVSSAGEDGFPASHIGVGHTRWATHGAPSVTNAHPHANTKQTVFVTHNGIIENYEEIRQSLMEEGYEFASETDTEVIPQLIDFYMRSADNFADAFEKALLDLRGAYAILAMSADEPETLYSDPSAVMAHTKEVIYLQDYEMIQISPRGHSIKNIKKAQKVVREIESLDFDINQAALGDFPNFMLKEIYEAPATIRSATLGRIQPATNTVKLGGLESVANQLRYIDRIVIVACGTSYYAGLVGEYLIEELAGIPVEVQLASEFKYRNEPFSRSTALLAISQSGETADTIAALKKVEDYGVLRLGVVNAVGSTIARMTDAGVYCHAGPEQAVASTKAFIAQVTVLSLIALQLSDQVQKNRSPLYKPLLQELNVLPQKAEAVLKQAELIETIAKKYQDYRDFLFIGRNYSYPCALEGALKLKEISYIHAEGYAAGEMKHGPLAMIDDQFPTFALAMESPLLEKTVSNIREIQARKGPVVAVATEGDRTVSKLADDTMYIPETLEATQPILAAIVMQLFSYYIATGKGFNVDRPRNLAKSVTVE
jgi:glutamine---fructose-6-phosphate transaminase (isomerizing)